VHYCITYFHDQLKYDNTKKKKHFNDDNPTSIVFIMIRFLQDTCPFILIQHNIYIRETTYTHIKYGSKAYSSNTSTYVGARSRLQQSEPFTWVVTIIIYPIMNSPSEAKKHNLIIYNINYLL
jgi:hypothetical protein